MKIRPPLSSSIATLYFSPDTETGGTAVLDPPAKEAAEPGKTSLGSAYRDALTKQQAAIAQPDPNAKKEPDVQKEGDVKAEKEGDKAEPKKPASPLDAVLEKPVDAKVEPSSDDPPANAPAKLLREAMERHKADAVKWKGEAEKASRGDQSAVEKTLKEIAESRAELEKLKARNAELSDAVTALNVDYDPEVRRKYHDGKNALVEKITLSVEQYGGDEKAFADAMGMKPGKARTEAILSAVENVAEINRARIFDKLTKIEDLEEEHADLLKNAQKSYADLTKRQQDRVVIQQAEVEKAKADVFGRATKGLPDLHPTIREVDDTVEGHEEWNARIKADHAAGLRLLGNDATLEEISAAAVKGARYDFVEGLLLEERKTSAELRDRIAKYESAEPGFDGRHKTDTVSKLDKTPGQIWREEMDKKRNKGD